MKYRSEARLVFIATALLLALTIPASAAAFGSPVEPVVPASAPVALASSAGLFTDAPPPLLVMAFGLLLITVTVTRRAMKTGIGASIDAG